MTDKETFLQARIAIRSGRDARAFLQLGLLYSKGIGTRKNHALSLYFLQKAADIGCEEADELIDAEFEERMKDIVSYIDGFFEGEILVGDPKPFPRIRRRLVRELKAGNDGCVSRQRYRLHHFFPEYNPKQAREDILAGRDTLQAELDYALCTVNNREETDMDEVEPFLAQYYAPFVKKKDLWRGLPPGRLPLNYNEKPLVRECLPNLCHTYNKLCEDHGLTPLPLKTIEIEDAFPYVPPSELRRVRREVYRCLLSLGNSFDCIKADFLPHLNSDNLLLDACEALKPAEDPVTSDEDDEFGIQSWLSSKNGEGEPSEENADLRLFLISFVDLNIQISSIIEKYRVLYGRFKRGSRNDLVEELNLCTETLRDMNLDPGLPPFTAYNLPVDVPASDLPF